jgi:DNA-binding MarR family transcriptional regulator
MHHRTTIQKSTLDPVRGPWLTSLAMWSNCLRYVGEEGVPVQCLPLLARTETNMHGMQRWGWVRVGSDQMIRPTRAACRAREIWPSLLGDVEERWRQRFGIEAVEKLRANLSALAGRLDSNLPDCLPILGYGLVTQISQRKSWPAKDCGAVAPEVTLAALLSKVLLAFALEFETKSKISLAIAANVLRLTGTEGVRVRDLPNLSGIAKPGIAVAISFLTKRGYARVQSEASGSRVNLLSLTPKGEEARESYHSLVQRIEDRWSEAFGAATIAELRQSLERLVGDPTASPLFGGLEPYPDGWRAADYLKAKQAGKALVLPHYPMVSHRGGFPDGS